MYVKSKVVLLANPLSQDTPSGIYLNDGKWYNLYILSDDEIKVGDYYCMGDSIMNPVEDAAEADRCNNYPAIHLECKKIIASTDESLIQSTNEVNTGMGDEEHALPQPSKAFIDKYITEYNKGNIIKEVLVEYEEYGDELGCDPAYYGLDSHRPKVSNNNTITIKKIKDSWSREEVEALCRDAHDTGGAYCFSSEERFSLDNWINENL